MTKLLWLALAAGTMNAQSVLYEGARLIIGDRSAPIENGAFLVQNGRFTAKNARGGLTLWVARRVETGSLRSLKPV